MQVLIGEPNSKVDDEHIPMFKHGKLGGECHHWHLQEEDYVIFARFVFDFLTGELEQATFETINGDIRVIGVADNWSYMNDYYFAYNKRMIGLGTMDMTGSIIAIGPFDSYCSHFPV